MIRLLIFFGVAFGVVWFAQHSDWSRAPAMPTARELGANAAEILAEFREGASQRPESAAADSSHPLGPESAAADSSHPLGSESAVADSLAPLGSESAVESFSGGVLVRQESFGGEGPVDGDVVPSEADAVEPRVPLERADAREIQGRLDRVMSLAAGRKR